MDDDVTVSTNSEMGKPALYMSPNPATGEPDGFSINASPSGILFARAGDGTQAGPYTMTWPQVAQALSLATHLSEAYTDQNSIPELELMERAEQWSNLVALQPSEV